MINLVEGIAIVILRNGAIQIPAMRSSLLRAAKPTAELRRDRARALGICL
jgi:uncharacterized membrane protein YcaP (DUF421 family)